MFLDKIKNNQNGILLYGITPPKKSTLDEDIQKISNTHINRISKLPIDGLVLYDIQDESERIQEKRPFHNY
ncbi:hypothetical protein HOK00_03350 [bacterium]|nr:hypothetical protein [bacterium]